MPIQFNFVLEGGPAKPEGADRSLIRSRSMLGKNKRNGSRRSIREQKRIAAASEQMTDCPRVPAPPPVDLALARLASETGPRSRELLHTLMTSRAVHFSISPLELCVDFDFAYSHEFDRLFYDSSFLSAALFTSSAINDLAISSRRQPSRESACYLGQTLSILSTNLDLKDAHRADSTMIVIMALALLSVVFGDWTAVSVHLTGLHRIVELCGGLKFLRQRPKMHYKIERIDLCWVLSSGNQPYFSPDLIGWDRTFRSRPLSFPMPLRMHSIHNLGNDKLGVVYEDLQYLTMKMNENVHEHARWKGDAFQKAFSSIQARLLHLMTEANEPLQELVCLGMLSLLTTFFRIPGRIIAYTHLANRFRKLSLIVFEKPLKSDVETLLFWGLMIAAVSIFVVEEETWLLEQGSVLVGKNLLDWHNAQALLRSVMWIDCIHDEAGEKVFERMRMKAKVHAVKDNKI